MLWRRWLLLWWAAIVFAGGVAQAVADTHPRKVVTTYRDVHVLPVGQAVVTGTITTLQAAGAIGPVTPLPLRTATGSVSITGAVVDGRAATIVWQGGRPFSLSGSGGLDLGATTLTVDGRGVTWPVDGTHALVPGAYTVDAPVAVGAGGLAEPRDQVTFTADAHTTIEVHGGTTVTAAARTLHLEGPGRLVIDGQLDVETRDGRRHVTHLDFGPGPFVVDVAGSQIRATLQGELR